MWRLEKAVADALGVRMNSPDEMIAELALRSAGIVASSTEMSRGTAKWITDVVILLGEHLGARSTTVPGTVAQRAQATADIAMSSLTRHVAPQVLAVLAPTQIVPARPASQNGAVCKALVARHLPGICTRLLTEWQGPAPDDDTPVWQEDEYDRAAARLGLD